MNEINNKMLIKKRNSSEETMQLFPVSLRKYYLLARNGIVKVNYDDVQMFC